MTNNDTDYNKGDKVKDFNPADWEKPHRRAIVTNTLQEQEEIEIMPIEGREKGETVTREPEEELKPLKKEIYLCMVGRSYGTSLDKATAVRNALNHYDVEEDRDEPVKLWIAEVDRNNWSIRGMGSVHSTFIDNEEDLEIEPDLAREIGDRAEDTQSLVHSALDGVEPYREGLNYEVVTNTRGY